jgi:hypothetical protein
MARGQKAGLTLGSMDTVVGDPERLAITQLVMHEIEAPGVIETLGPMARCAIYRCVAAARPPSAQS